MLGFCGYFDLDILSYVGWIPFVKHPNKSVIPR